MAPGYWAWTPPLISCVKEWPRVSHSVPVANGCWLLDVDSSLDFLDKGMAILCTGALSLSCRLEPYNLREGKAKPYSPVGATKAHNGTGKCHARRSRCLQQHVMQMANMCSMWVCLSEW